MTAAEYVALARRIAPGALDDFAQHAIGQYLSVRRDGALLISARPQPDAVLWCLLTTENSASEDALVRALLASAVRVDNTRAVLADAFDCYDAAAGETPHTATAALLDALLASPEAVR